jgi:NAD-dependent SIR2 family protein deacetylase
MADQSDLNERIERGALWMAAAKRIVVFTGAGISTDSGVPDFRGPEGVWTRRDKGLPPPKSKVSIDRAEPSAGHLAILELFKTGRLHFLISQNVDNLHIKSGIPMDMIAELHGNVALMKCLDCDRRFTKDEVGWDEDSWGKGYRTSKPVPGQPACECGGRIISSVVNFGDSMPEKEMALSMNASQECDLFVVVGSSLVVSPANSFPAIAVRAGAKLIIMNRGETPLDDLAHLRFEEGISEVLPPMVLRSRELIGPGKDNHR